jgi:hypothetical protein
MRASFRLLASSAVLVVLATIAAAQSSDFTIIALPDTQNEAQFFPGVLASQTEWIADHRDDLNIQMVLGEGDIVNDFSSPAQQQNADAAFRVLDRAGVPYMLAIGNHDYDHAQPKNGRPVTGFNRFFGPSRYAGRAYYRGNFPSGSNENFFGVVNIGGKDFLFLILEFMPRHESVEWAESVLEANPDKQVIVVTHSYMFVDNTRVDSCDTDDMPAGNSTGDDLWQQLRKFPNVIMVLSGHLTNGQAAHRSDIGDNGNLVNEIFANYQTFPNGGDGWLRIITFHPAKNSISVQTYSPFLKRFKTDKRNQFTAPYHNPHFNTGTGQLSGMVRSASDCEPIAGATVSTNSASTTTDGNGRYSLALAPGNHQLSVSIPGWSGDAKSETVFDGFDTDLNFFLTQSAEAPCPLNSNLPSVTICSPTDGSAVNSPVNIVAATNDASTVTSIEAILDGAEVSHFQSGVLETSVNAEAGNHHLVVKARDKSGTSFESSVDFNVSSPVVPGPPLPTPTPASERLSLTISPSEAAITLGHSADFSVQLGTDGSLKDPVSFSCSGLPAGTRCAFDPVRMKAANLPGTVKLTIFTNAVTSASIRGGLRGLIWASILAPGMVLLGYKRRGRGVLLSLCGLFLLATGLLLGCQGVISPANKGSFTVTVTSSSGTVQKSSNINLKLE